MNFMTTILDTQNDEGEGVPKRTVEMGRMGLWSVGSVWGRKGACGWG